MTDQDCVKQPERNETYLITEFTFHERPYLMEFLLDKDGKTLEIHAEKQAKTDPDSNREGDNIERARLGELFACRVERILDHPHAAFVTLSDQGKENLRGYLPLKEGQHVFFTDRSSKHGGFRPGDCLLLSVSKEAVREKDAVMTTSFTLESSHLLYRYSRGGLHFSRVFPEERTGELQEKLKERSLIPEQGTLVIRSNALSLDDDALLEEASLFFREIRAFLKRASSYHGIARLKKRIPHYTEICLHRSERIRRVVTDLPQVLSDLSDAGIRNDSPFSVSLYEDALPMSVLYSLSKRLKEATDRTVYLKSGGNLVIEKTEAMYVMDVNSGKAVNTERSRINEEACREAARQIRLRNLSGILMIDFLKTDEKGREDLIRIMKEETKADFSMVRVYGFTALGVMELSREKLESSLSERLTDNR